MTDAKVPILEEGDGWFAVAKPAGTLVIPGRPGQGGESGPSLRERLEAEQGGKIFTVHRLDRDTSGVVVFARTAEAHRALSMAFEEGRVEKRYLALVAGQLEGPQDVTVALAPARRGRMRPVRPGEEGKAAKTLVRPLELFSTCTLVEALPLTGRTHQIRVHLLSLGHPLLVDHQYGRAQPVRPQDVGLTGVGEEPLLTRTPLHAERIRLPGLGGRPARTIVAPLADDLATLLERMRAQGLSLKLFDTPR